MRYILTFTFIAMCVMGSMALVASPPPNPGVVVVPTPPPAPTMAQDLDEIVRMVNFLQIRQLMTRYLLNDAQFQGFVRILNSHDAYVTYMRFRSQPEVMAFIAWVNAQILLSGGELQVEESEEFMTIINPTPFWANTVSGWQGFVNEFFFYYPADMISMHINMKVGQNGIFTQFWQRLKALKPVYDRVVAMPEAQRVAAALQLNGIDILQLDTFIRNQFGWQMPPTLAPSTTTTTTTTAAPVVSSTEAVLSSTASVPSSTASAPSVEPSVAAPVAPEVVPSSTASAPSVEPSVAAPVAPEVVAPSSTASAPSAEPSVAPAA
ncbi:uncharacterized protein LOC101895222 [Musca domestica]|uniref:Uncharacterized protein LOC101895222 n=1 Tax=Musca domestica TaxID=7370 RepID=A0A1I8M234_MUSDO|nr:uncharacterized protein LOC101895222 [Musca domestica]